MNYDERCVACRATIGISGLRAGQLLEVVDEQGSISAAAGSFHDTFEPLTVHIYRTKPSVAP